MNFHSLQVGLAGQAFFVGRAWLQGKSTNNETPHNHHDLGALNAELGSELGQVFLKARTIAFIALYKGLFCSWLLVVQDADSKLEHDAPL